MCEENDVRRGGRGFSPPRDVCGDNYGFDGEKKRSRRVWVDHMLRAARAVGACDEDRPRVREPVCSLEGAKQLPR